MKSQALEEQLLGFSYLLNLLIFIYWKEPVRLCLMAARDLKGHCGYPEKNAKHRISNH